MPRPAFALHSLEVFERFTERARQVVVLAQDEARRLQHNYIGTEHLLLGLLREEEGIAARVLGSLGVTADEVRAEVERVVGQGDEVPTGQIPFTPRAKHALERSLREALTLGHKHIGTEHVLLGVVSEENGVAARILEELGASAEKVRDEVYRSLRGGPAPASQFEPVLPDAPLETRPVMAPWIVTSAASLGVGLLLGWLIWG
jgi:ATP-dependent Clp protease ATP-binding subunit ClpC